MSKTTAEQAAPKRLGRPPLAPDAPRSDKRPRSIRLGDAAWAELQRRGTEALEAWLAKPIRPTRGG